MVNKKIKVAHVITKLELGGAQGNTLYTCEHLNNEIFDVYLICGRGGYLDKKAIDISKKCQLKLFFVSHLIRQISLFWDFMALIELLILLDKIKPDIVHTHSSKAGILARFAAFFVKKIRGLRGSKIIHTYHGFGFNEYQNILKKNLFIFLEYLCSHFSDKLIFVSNSNIEYAKKYDIVKNEKQISLIRSGVKINLYRNSLIDKDKKIKFLKDNNLNENSFFISTIGPFKKQKNLKDFIIVAYLIKKNLKEKHDIKFLIAGDGKLRNNLIKLSKSLNVQNDIVFLSWVRDVSLLLSVTKIFVMTSLWEGLPRSAVEALLSGVPVVAYNTDGLNDIVINDFNGFLVEKKDVKSLSKIIVNLINNENNLIKLSNNAKNSIDEMFDIDFMVKQQEELYNKLVK